MTSTFCKTARGNESEMQKLVLHTVSPAMSELKPGLQNRGSEDKK